MESTYDNDSLLLMKYCREKIIIHGTCYWFNSVREMMSLQRNIKVWPFGLWGECIFDCVHLRSANGLRFLWPPASTVRALSLEGQLPSAFAWSCLFNLTQWRKARHWPESAALMCFMFCIHHCHQAGDDCLCHRREVCVCACVCVYCRWVESMINFSCSITIMK